MFDASLVSCSSDNEHSFSPYMFGGRGMYRATFSHKLAHAKGVVFQFEATDSVLADARADLNKYDSPCLASLFSRHTTGSSR
jgi:hypothetical protein